jgi:hypothetical protein
MSQIKLFFIFFFSMSLLIAQNVERKGVQGKVISDGVDLEGIYIINLKLDINTTTSKGGYFTIQAAVGDTLLFSAMQIKGTKIVVTEHDFGPDLFRVKLLPMVNRLDEVVVRKYDNINAVSLGIVASNVKRFTPAERRLYTASGMDARSNKDGTMGGSIGIDPLFSLLSGRTALLKKELAVEHNESILKKIEDEYGFDFFIEKLKIPKDYVKAFWYYIVDDPRLVNAMNAKNRVMTTFIITELSTKYLSLMQSDTK